MFHHSLGRRYCVYESKCQKIELTSAETAYEFGFLLEGIFYTDLPASTKDV